MPRLTSKPLAVAAALVVLAATACSSSSDSHSGDAGLALPAAPAGVGHADVAAMADPAVDPAFTDSAVAATNQRGDPCLATTATNAGVRVLARFLDLWTPSTLVVDGGYWLGVAAANGCAAIPAATWTGIPGLQPDGTEVSSVVLHDSVQYVVSATSSRTDAQAVAAYYDDRRSKGYSVTDGLGPLTQAWRVAARQTTTITSIPADATTAKYDDKGNNTGVGGPANVEFGKVVDLVNAMGNNGSTEPAKRFYKHARPFRWTAAFPDRWPAAVSIPAILDPVISTSAGTDGGFPSGHAAEATRDVIGMAYVLPERFQELIARGLELGENRILAGMHTPLDVMGGRVQATAVAAANLVALSPAAREAAREQARTTLMSAVGAVDDAAFHAFAHSATATDDRFADRATNVARNARWLTYALPRNPAVTRPALVPKRAEILLETRFPYLTADQRRVVLKTTALPAGYPVLDDAEGWGRLDLFTAADGYAAFDGDVLVTMDASAGGFSAADAWRNDISGAGKLTKAGTGRLHLSGENTYAGGTQVVDGVLQADSAAALGSGDVYLSSGTLVSAAPAALRVGGKLTQRSGAALRVVLGGGTAGRIVVADTATIEGGVLSVGFAPGAAQPAAGDTLDVITARSLVGALTTVEVDGFRVTPIHTSTGVKIRIDGR